MDNENLDKLVMETHEKLVRITDSNVFGFVEEANEFFRAPNDSVDYYRRLKDLKRPSNSSSWIYLGSVRIIETEYDLRAIYFNFRTQDSYDDTVFVDLDKWNSKSGYAFIPKKGLYLNQESENYAQDKLLVFSD